MRFARYFLFMIAVAILLIGLIGVGIGLFSQRPSKLAVKQKPKREVFVDIDQLVLMHPGWDAAKTIDATVAGARLMKQNMLKKEAAPVSEAMVLSELRAQAEVPRWELEAAAAQAADESLQRLKTEQMMALQGRIQASRKTMLDSAEADIMVSTREIRQATQARIDSIANSRTNDVANLQLRARALRALIGKPGVNDAETTRQLALVETELEVIEESVQIDVSRVSDDAQQTITQLKKSAKDKIDAAMDAYRRTETAKIQARIDAAQSAIMKDVVSFDTLSLADVFGSEISRPTGSAASFVPLKTTTQPSFIGDISLWVDKAEALKQRVRADVKSQVSRLADRRNVRVVFVNDRDLPDETGVFAGLIWKRGARKGAPIIYGQNGI